MHLFVLSTRCGQRTGSIARRSSDFGKKGGRVAPAASRHERRSAPTPALRARCLAPAQPDLLGEFGTLGCIVWSYHGVIGGESPLCTISVGRQVVTRANITLQHLQPLSVFKADDVFGTDRFFNRYSGFLCRWQLRAGAPGKTAKRRMNALDHARNFRNWSRIVADVSGYDIARELNEFVGFPKMRFTAVAHS